MTSFSKILANVIQNIGQGFLGVPDGSFVKFNSMYCIKIYAQKVVEVF